MAERDGPGTGSPALSIGLDLVDIPRFSQVMSRRPAIVDRLFTAEERAYAESQANPAPSLAARFAAKEAVMKALGVGLGAFQFADVEIERLASGEPRLRLTGRAADLASAGGYQDWLVSLTHTATTAAAVVVALR